MDRKAVKIFEKYVINFMYTMLTKTTFLVLFLTECITFNVPIVFHSISLTFLISKMENLKDIFVQSSHYATVTICSIHLLLLITLLSSGNSTLVKV